jgi:hypothetical protein
VHPHRIRRENRTFAALGDHCLTWPWHTGRIRNPCFSQAFSTIRASDQEVLLEPLNSWSQVRRKSLFLVDPAIRASAIQMRPLLVLLVSSPFGPFGLVWSEREVRSGGNGFAAHSSGLKALQGQCLPANGPGTTHSRWFWRRRCKAGYSAGPERRTASLVAADRIIAGFGGWTAGSPR